MQEMIEAFRKDRDKVSLPQLTVSSWHNVGLSAFLVHTCMPGRSEQTEVTTAATCAQLLHYLLLPTFCTICFYLYCTKLSLDRGFTLGILILNKKLLYFCLCLFLAVWSTVIVSPKVGDPMHLCLLDHHHHRHRDLLCVLHIPEFLSNFFKFRSYVPCTKI